MFNNVPKHSCKHPQTLLTQFNSIFHPNPCRNHVDTSTFFVSINTRDICVIYALTLCNPATYSVPLLIKMNVMFFISFLIFYLFVFL